jgi:hypothetical protein
MSGFLTMLRNDGVAFREADNRNVGRQAFQVSELMMRIPGTEHDADPRTCFLNPVLQLPGEAR